MYFNFSAFSMILSEKGVYAFGWNRSGQLGLGNIKDQPFPKKLMSGCDIKMIACGINHSLVLKTSGELFSFGSNSNGQLGLGEEFDYWHPKLVMSDPRISFISSGAQHTLLYKDNGELYVFGCNSNGQLGINNHFKDINQPKLFLKDKEIKQICCGAYFSTILKKSGEFLLFGDNSKGQLGTGDFKNRSTPHLLLKDDQIKKVYCGAYFVYYLRNNGQLYVLGNNTSGQLGIGNHNDQTSPKLMMEDSQIKSIACGAFHSLILKNNGDLYVVGQNYCGQLGLKAIQNSNVPILLMNDTNIKSVCCGAQHSFILKNDGELLLFGNNQYGQLGFGTNSTYDIIKPQKLLKDSSIKMLHYPTEDWTCSTHSEYPLNFRKGVYVFFLCLKIIHKEKQLKIPRFVLYEIIKKFQFFISDRKKSLFVSKKSPPLTKISDFNQQKDKKSNKTKNKVKKFCLIM